MKIQLADDTIITTYNPSRVGTIGINATKTPDAGDSALIEIEIICANKNNYLPATLLCKQQDLLYYQYYQKYMEVKLK